MFKFVFSNTASRCSCPFGQVHLVLDLCHISSNIFANSSSYFVDLGSSSSYFGVLCPTQLSSSCLASLLRLSRNILVHDVSHANPSIAGKSRLHFVSFRLEPPVSLQANLLNSFFLAHLACCPEAIFSACELGACTCCFPPGGNLQISCLVRLAMARRHGSPRVFVSMCGPLPPRHPRRVLIVFLINVPPPTNKTTIIFSFVALPSCLDAMAQPSVAPLLAIEPAGANALSRCFTLSGRRDPTLLLHRAILSTRWSPFLWWPRRHVLVESSQTCSCAFVVFHLFVTSRGLFLPPHRASCSWSSIFLLSSWHQTRCFKLSFDLKSFSQ